MAESHWCWLFTPLRATKKKCYKREEPRSLSRKSTKKKELASVLGELMITVFLVQLLLSVVDKAANRLDHHC